jgi:nitroreductase
MESLDAIAGRRSVREYAKKDVSEATVRKVLEAGRWAPSGLNNQPWRFKVLRGAQKDSIAPYTTYGHTIKAAPVCIAVFFDEEAGYDRTKDMQSIGACIQNMLLAAHDLGLGAVWLGEILNQREKVEDQLEIHYELMAVIALGHPAEEGGAPERIRLEELLI